MQWAVQNAVGALFAAAFAVVADLQFALACLVGVLYRQARLCQPAAAMRHNALCHAAMHAPARQAPPRKLLNPAPCPPCCSASSLVLSLDRTVGGRVFGGVVFIGTVGTGGALGELPAWH
jgi:hypothetical protein